MKLNNCDVKSSKHGNHRKNVTDFTNTVNSEIFARVLFSKIEPLQNSSLVNKSYIVLRQGTFTCACSFS